MRPLPAALPLTSSFHVPLGGHGPLGPVSVGHSHVVPPFCVGFNFLGHVEARVREEDPSCLWENVSRRAFKSHACKPNPPSSGVLMAVLSPGGCTPVVGCNETRMLEMLPRCGKAFADRMHEVDAWKWCNLSEFVV